MADIDPDDTIEIMRASSEEARQILDHQIQALADIDSKAIKVVRVNLLLIGTLLTAFSLSSTAGFPSVSDFINLYTTGGMICLLLSTTFAALTYRGTDIKTGIESQEFKNITEEEYELQTYYENLLIGYSNWIEFNEKENVRKIFPFMLTIILIIWALFLLSLGTAQAIIGSLPLPLVVVIIIGLSILSYFTGVVRYARRWRSTFKSNW